MNELFYLGLILVFVGIFFITISVLYDALKRKSNVKVEGGGVVFIGPVPIVFGTSAKIVYLSVLITILILLYIFVVVKL